MAAKLAQRYGLVLLGDSCSGVPGHIHEANFQAIREALSACALTDRTLCYLGDHVSGYVDTKRELRLQWRYFLQREFAALADAFDHIYHIPGNHDVYDRKSLEVYDQILPVDAIANLAARKQLNYAVCDGEALLVFLNTADPANHGHAIIDVSWLEEALTAGDDASVKLVFGHHPILPVNGYADYPNWRVSPELGDRAWSLMLAHGVRAYICSHIIAFDFRARGGLVQLCTGGAGTEYGPGGAMPGETEYRHFVACDVSEAEISYRVFDETGQCREQLTWPPSLKPPLETLMLLPGRPAICRALPQHSTARPSDGAFFVNWTLRGDLSGNSSGGTLLAGRKDAHSAPMFSIDTGGTSGRLTVRLESPSGKKPHLWTGPELKPNAAISYDVAAHGGAGPGGVLLRVPGGQWSSLESSSACGIAEVGWPLLWEALAGTSNHAPSTSFHVHMSVHNLAGY